MAWITLQLTRNHHISTVLMHLPRAPLLFPKDVVPALPGVYVFYVDGEVYYVGSSCSLRERLRHYGDRASSIFNADFFREKTVVVKFSVSKKSGEWLMREYRLIRRLKPRANIRDNKAKTRHGSA